MTGLENMESWPWWKKISFAIGAGVILLMFALISPIKVNWKKVAGIAACLLGAACAVGTFMAITVGL